jgi:hypothetical protein
MTIIEPEHMAFLLKPSNTYLTINQIIRITGLKKSGIYNLARSGAFEMNLYGENNRVRTTKRFTRRSVLTWLMTTATYIPDEFVPNCLTRLVEELSDTDLADLLTKIKEQAQIRANPWRKKISSV